MFIILLDLILYCAILCMYTVYANKYLHENYFPAVKYGKSIFDFKKVSVMYFRAGICAAFLAALGLIANHWSTDFQGEILIITIQIMLILLLAFPGLSIMKVEVYVIFEEEDIRLRQLSIKEQLIRYKDISFYTMDDKGNIKLYQDSQCVIKFALKNRKEQLLKELDEHHVSRKE